MTPTKSDTSQQSAHNNDEPMRIVPPEYLAAVLPQHENRLPVVTTNERPPRRATQQDDRTKNIFKKCFCGLIISTFVMIFNSSIHEDILYNMQVLETTCTITDHRFEEAQSCDITCDCSDILYDSDRMISVCDYRFLEVVEYDPDGSYTPIDLFVDGFRCNNGIQCCEWEEDISLHDGSVICTKYTPRQICTYLCKDIEVYTSTCTDSDGRTAVITSQNFDEYPLDSEHPAWYYGQFYWESNVKLYESQTSGLYMESRFRELNIGLIILFVVIIMVWFGLCCGILCLCCGCKNSNLQSLFATGDRRSLKPQIKTSKSAVQPGIDV